MTTLVNTFKAKESDTLVWTLEERRGSQNNLVWVTLSVTKVKRLWNEKLKD